MTDSRRESLSALIDGEASEIEIHRLVREFRSDETLTTSWARYQVIGSVVRTDTDPFTTGQHLQLFERIAESIENEDAHSKIVRKPLVTRKRVAGSLALAASMVVAVFIGIQQPAENLPVAANGIKPVNTSNQSPVLDVQTVANQSKVEPRTSELVELDEEKQRRLRAYLNQHDQMIRMNSGKQFVNYKEIPNK